MGRVDHGGVPTRRGSFPHELRDYALLADGQRGILADPDGERAWMCFPKWSDPAVLASLSDPAASYRIRPKGATCPEAPTRMARSSGANVG